MKQLATKLLTKQGQIVMKNAAAHCLLNPDDEVDSQQLPISCKQVTAKVNAAAMPSKDSPTSLGSAALEPGERKKMNEEEVNQFLQRHGLTAMKGLEGIAWKAKKVQYALEKNNKLIKPLLSRN
jgi:hypothetical protein